MSNIYLGQHWASVHRGSFLSTMHNAHRNLLVGPQETLSILTKSEASFYKCVFIFICVSEFLACESEDLLFKVRVHAH